MALEDLPQFSSEVEGKCEELASRLDDRQSEPPVHAEEELVDAVGDGVEAELGDALDASGGSEDVLCFEPELGASAQVDGGKVGGCEDQGHHGRSRL